VFSPSTNRVETYLGSAAEVLTVWENKAPGRKLLGVWLPVSKKKS
jgi:hypothetical protein